MSIKFNPSPSVLGTPATASGDMRVVGDLNVVGVLSAGGISGSGESNTAANLSGDQGLYSNKSGVSLRFRSLTAGDNITLASGSTAITISAAASSANPGGSDTQVQYNNNGSFSGSSTFTFDGSGSVAATFVSGTTSISGALATFYDTSVATLTASNHVSASAFYGDGSNLTGISATTSPGGSDTEVQFNNNGSFSGSSAFTFDGSGSVAATFVSGTTSVSGAVATFYDTTVSTLTASNYVSASAFYGDGSSLTGISATSSPGGSDTQVQFNNNGSFSGSSAFTFDGSGSVAATFVSGTTSISGALATFYDATVATLTASNHVSASAFYGDGTTLSGIESWCRLIQTQTVTAGSQSSVTFSTGISGNRSYLVHGRWVNALTGDDNLNELYGYINIVPNGHPASLPAAGTGNATRLWAMAGSPNAADVAGLVVGGASTHGMDFFVLYNGAVNEGARSGTPLPVTSISMGVEYQTENPFPAGLLGYGAVQTGSNQTNSLQVRCIPQVSASRAGIGSGSTFSVYEVLV